MNSSREDVEPVRDLWVAALDSIRPYQYVYPTGAVVVDAPNLDSRDFVSPDSLREKIAVALPDVALYTGLPGRSYAVLGEVVVPLVIFYREYGEEVTDVMAPHGRPYCSLRGVQWDKTLERLCDKGARLGADALIEVFCGRGVGLDWHPPTVTTIPFFGPNGYISGFVPISSSGGFVPSEWALYGLAVRWRDQGTEPADSPQ